MAPTIFLDNINPVPFEDVFCQYVEKFCENNYLEISPILINKLQRELLKELSSYAEVTIHLELENFIKLGGHNFDDFCKKIKTSLATSYPILNDKLKTKTENFSNYIFKIISCFQKDKKEIIETFNLKNNTRNLKVLDIDLSLGDGHNGESTAVVKLSDGTKLIFKPRNIEITTAYNSFIEWIKLNLEINLKTFKILDKETYGWLEFVDSKEVTYQEDLQNYYYNTGVLLAVTMVLGSKDYHRENIIASCKNPVLVDHETIIQPYLQNNSVFSWDKVHKIPEFSVLESALIVNSEIGIPKELVGFGIRGYLEIMEPEKKIINQNSIDSKRVIHFRTRRLVEKNVPKYNGNYVFASEYKEDFKNGFCAAYDLLLKSKRELKSINSPIEEFKNKEVRYVWRPTFVYSKILKYLRNPAFMVSNEAYETKLYELLSKAYKGDHMDEYRFILDFEMKQMLNGDIPIFSLKSTDNFLEGNTNFRIFERNCMENIHYRIDKLSKEHKKEQIKYIENWLNIQI